MELFNNIYETAKLVSVFLLVTGLVVAFVRVLIGPTLPDRVVAFDLLVAAIVGLIIVLGNYDLVSLNLDVALAIALITFMGAVAIAKYLNRKT